MYDADKEWADNQLLKQNEVGYQSGAERFSNKKIVRQFADNVLGKKGTRVEDQLNCLNFEKGATVLDIGAGPGTLAVPLAKRGCSVSVVEPSIPMLEAMDEYIKIAGVNSDIKRINKNWEDVTEEDFDLEIMKDGGYDYVISSFAMAVPRLKEALLKMNAVCKKQVHIFWFLTTHQRMKPIDDLWFQIHKTERRSKLLANVIWECLYQNGINANIEVMPMKEFHFYESIDDATDQYFEEINASTQEQRQIIYDYLAENLYVNSQGKYSFKEQGYYAHIFWNKQ